MKGGLAGKRTIIMFKFVIPAFAALSLAASAHAKETPVTTMEAGMTVVRMSVPYADLDLTSEAGAATLNARIVAAAKEVCGQPDVRGFSPEPSWQECRKNAVEDAMQQVAALQLTSPQVASAH